MAVKKHRTLLSPLFLIFLIPSLFLNAYLIYNRSEVKGVRVVGVIDGDTLVLEGKIRVRLRQADAPELMYCGGVESKKYLESLVLDKSVRLDEQVPDQLGRGMALIYLGRILINEEMIKAGWVRYHHDVTSTTGRLKAASTYAKENRIGVFGQCQSTVPVNNKCIIKGNIDQHGVKKYYLPDCAQYKFTVVEKDMGEDWFCSESSAGKAGFTRAETCSKN